LYVGGSGPGNYTNIQEAIDNATDGDTVFVYHGTYSVIETTQDAIVYINKPINLIGENKYNTTIRLVANTIINSSEKYFVIRISATSNVHISGFTIIAVHGQYVSGIYVDRSNNITVNDTISIESHIGIRIDYGSNISLFNNVISNNTIGCNIYINPKNNCSLHDNFFLNNTNGIELQMGSPYIEHNEIKGNTQGISISNTNGIIRFNNFIENDFNVRYDLRLSLIQCILFLLHKQKYDSNYWDNWKASTPKPIFGIALILIIIDWPGLNPAILPIGLYPFIMFDRHPAQEPYDIPGMT
jgi:nitrous oxidase accessory protein